MKTDNMALVIKCRHSHSCIYLLCPILLMFMAWQLGAGEVGAEAKQLPLAADAGIRHGSYDNGNDDVAALVRKRRQLSDWLIAPNTRWCGRGNLANGTYNDLGGASMADKCCRKHDHCQLWIDGMSTRYDLFNYRPYTLSHCSCDRRFRTCLKMAGDEAANAIGKLFFNVVQTQCFSLRVETVCLERGAGSSGQCLREDLRQKAVLRNNKRF
ncbi:acidic phospholipase A2 PA4 [Drosophila pseudoobscura]|uniref:phospholipase A2 n=1 Tax=Drosophila pseudoobscura pseudoobscura TaxID=46245 RepID=Q29HD0_DROPS|nr:acidic phospholipase A2 PA4 [Drosophila pseudoobscura]